MMQLTKYGISITWALVALFITMMLVCGGKAHAAQCTTCGNGETGTPETPPSAVLSHPDFAMQFNICLPLPIPGYIVGTLQSAIVKALIQLDLKSNDSAPNPDIQQQCINGKHVVAAWFAPPFGYGNWDSPAARAKTISQVNLLKPGEQVALHFADFGIDRLVDVAWRDLPSSLDTNAKPSANGPIYLESVRTDYYNTFFPFMKQVVTTIQGYFDGPLSSDTWWAKATDTMSLAGGRVMCGSDVGVRLETTVQTILAQIFGVIHNLDSLVSGFITQSPGCLIAETLPTDIPIPGTKHKESFAYSRLEVLDGIIVGGHVTLVPRQPVVEIEGPNPVQALVGHPATATFIAVTTDMRPPLTVTWASPHATFGASTVTTGKWNFPSNTGTHGSTITVTITDADGLTASSTKFVTIEFLADPSKPPICSKNDNKAATLPQCNP